MQVTLNGRPRELSEGCTASDLVRELGLQGRRFAIEINGEIVPRGEHASRRLAPDDRIEVVHAVGGG